MDLTTAAARLMSNLAGRKNSTSRFSIPADGDDLAIQLLDAYTDRVRKKNNTTLDLFPTLPYIREAARWLSDPTLPPCLFIAGKPGNGKTTLARAIVDIFNRHFADDLRSLSKEFRWIAAWEINKDNYRSIAEEPFLAIDDLGTETAEQCDYGTWIPTMARLLERRYDNNLSTIITTNLNTISKRYDERIADRFRETMHIITFRNPSFRNNQPK